MKKACIILIASLIFFTHAAAFAESRSGEKIAADLVIMRPLGVAATVVGTAVFVVSLPFALITNDVPKTAKELVVDPFNYTFERRLGDFKYQTDDPMLEDSPAKE
jgi:hypothetical protein